jgi:NAD(P)-dependent dehydrogenase (short-subunit alcohol dehydrogenase family)
MLTDSGSDLPERAGYLMTSDQLAGRVAVVTGGSSGIGAAVINAMLEVGINAVSLDLREPAEPQPGARYITADVTDRSALEAAFQSIDEQEGRVDILVNNAGFQRVGRTEEYDPDSWREVIDVHLFGMFHCTALAIPRMKALGGGAIVSVASTAAIVGLPGRGPYSAAKGAIGSFTRSLAVELAPNDIRVNAVAPGSTMTPLVQQGLDDGSIGPDFIKQIPMRRLAEPLEIARCIRFLASEDASYVTGATLVVDGGWTIQGIRMMPPEWSDD